MVSEMYFILGEVLDESPTSTNLGNDHAQSKTIIHLTFQSYTILIINLTYTENPRIDEWIGSGCKFCILDQSDSTLGLEPNF